jgi:hypothetical protein
VSQNDKAASINGDEGGGDDDDDNYEDDMDDLLAEAEGALAETTVGGCTDQAEGGDSSAKPPPSTEAGPTAAGGGGSGNAFSEDDGDDDDDLGGDMSFEEESLSMSENDLEEAGSFDSDTAKAALGHGGSASAGDSSEFSVGDQIVVSACTHLCSVAVMSLTE